MCVFSYVLICRFCFMADEVETELLRIYLWWASCFIVLFLRRVRSQRLWVTRVLFLLLLSTFYYFISNIWAILKTKQSRKTPVKIANLKNILFFSTWRLSLNLAFISCTVPVFLTFIKLHCFRTKWAHQMKATLLSPSSVKQGTLMLWCTRQ